jgi:hypothetical protein
LVQSPLYLFVKLGLVLDDAAALPAQGKARAQDDRVTDLFGDFARLSKGGSVPGLAALKTDLGHGSLEEESVFRLSNRVHLGANQFDAML